MKTSAQTAQEVLSVTQLNRQARQLLETHLSLLWVEGEISNFIQPSSGHWYFTLKDEKAQVRCAMFRNRNQRVSFRPENGTHILLRCRVSLYEERGDYQLIAEHMEEAGYGALQRRFDLLKAKLHEEGLFDQAYKQPLPDFPGRIGVISSPTGAALQDILTVLERRFPAIPVTVYPTTVQGETAAGQIASCIAWANRDGRCDVLIVGRGGGSQEDLWPFNEEVVARAIFASEIPIVSAVGHEIDFTIADFVADHRAPTPSAAAELLSPDGEDISAILRGFSSFFEQHIARLISLRAEQLQALRQRLRHPKERFREYAQRLDYLEVRLRQAFSSQLERRSSKLAHLQTRFAYCCPSERLLVLREQLEELESRLKGAIHITLQNKRNDWRETSHLLHTVSPLKTLERGYAIVLDEEQRNIKSVHQVSPGDKVSAKVADGVIPCQVLESA